MKLIAEPKSGHALVEDYLWGIFLLVFAIFMVMRHG
jgi:hypothetical protein